MRKSRSRRYSPRFDARNLAAPVAAAAVVGLFAGLSAYMIEQDNPPEDQRPSLMVVQGSGNGVLQLAGCVLEQTNKGPAVRTPVIEMRAGRHFALLIPTELNRAHMDMNENSPVTAEDLAGAYSGNGSTLYSESIDAVHTTVHCGARIEGNALEETHFRNESGQQIPSIPAGYLVNITGGPATTGGDETPYTITLLPGQRGNDGA